MTKKNWTLYKHTFPSGKVYIGITSRNPYKRWAYGHGYKNCILFHRAIIKYGWDNIRHEVLFDNLSEEDAKRLEIELIKIYKAQGISYNITNGGDGCPGHTWKWSEERRKKFRPRNMRGANNPNYGNHKLAGRNHPLYGKTHTEEAREKIRQAATGRTHKMSEEQKATLIKVHSKPIIQLDFDNNIIAKFDSAANAARFYGKGTSTASHITACCRGKRNKCLNYKWVYG